MLPYTDKTEYKYGQYWSIGDPLILEFFYVLYHVLHLPATLKVIDKSKYSLIQLIL